MSRCVWCNQSKGELRTIVLEHGRQRESFSVHPDHEALVADWHAFAVKHEQEFILRFTLLPLVLFAAIGLSALVDKRLMLVAVGLGLVFVARTLWRFPFATPQTVSLVGIRRSVRIARGLAIAVGLARLALACVAWWIPAHLVAARHVARPLR